jgi:hypothetical protein
MTQIATRGCPIHPGELTYFVGLEKNVACEAVLNARVRPPVRGPSGPSARRYRTEKFDLVGLIHDRARGAAPWSTRTGVGPLCIHGMFLA